MRIFSPLRDRAVASVWGSQVLSSMGDEMNRVAVVWLAAGLWGSGAGYVMAVHAACAFLSSLLGGPLVERFDVKPVLVVADAVRAVAVAAIPLGAWLGVPLAPLLLASVAICATFSAVFEPALRSSLPVLVPSAELLGPTNALLESTARFARVLGPGLIALAGAWLPTVQLFSLDAVTFVVSGLALSAVSRARFSLKAQSHEHDERPTPVAVYRLTARAPAVRYAVLSGAWVTAAWTFVLPLGIGLYVHERMPTDVSALGAVLAAYGVGNLASNLLLGNLVGSVRPERLMFGGRVLAGVGFVAFALAPNTPLLWLSAAFAAAGGPATDVGFLGMLQARFDGREMARVYRLNLAASYGVMLVMFFASPRLVEWLGAAPLIQLCGACLLLLGAVGLIRFGGRNEGVEIASA